MSASTPLFQVHTGAVAAQVPEAVLFPFDPWCVPFVRGLRVHLEKPTRKPPVLTPGPPGSTDSLRIQFYGTVIRVGDEFRMWYLGLGDGEGEDGRAHDLHVCYATSTDGVNWTRPSLGLVEYGGSKENNRVKIEGIEDNERVYAALVLHEPDDPDPARRFKMTIELPRYTGQLAVAFSPDGLTWTMLEKNPVGPLHEFSGLTKVNGYYVLNGHGGTGCNREMEVLASYDFETWTTAPARGLTREKVAPDPNATTNRWKPPVPLPVTKEVHIGASLWNRGNVILTFYGDWRWNPVYPDERKHVRINLGFMTSPDGLHYHEPLADYPILPAAENWIETEEWDARLIQGQGFENIGDETFMYHGVGHTGAHLSTWPLDRIGCLHTHEHGTDWRLATILGYPHFLSCPITPNQDGARVYLNVEFLTEHGTATVELCDEQFRPLPHYAGDNAIPLNQSGFRVPVKWKGGETYDAAGTPFRVRVNYGGIRPEDVRVYAVYVA